MSRLRPLLENLIDYAGLFPPSALPMNRAIENYQRYRVSPESWMLARFVVPVARLDELEASLNGPAPLISALIGADLEADLARIARSPLPIDTIELKVSNAGQIDAAMRRIQPHLTPYIEIADAALIPVIKSAGARAKIRTGGVTPDAFPSAKHVAKFIETCARHETPFKATAGLHHPLRCYRPLTYSADGPSGWMFGFLNVFLAAALARKGRGPLEPVLLAESFNDHGLTPEDFSSTRRDFAISFGSCSFEEPVEDLRALGLL
ncbi:MAG: hypothetical protein LAO79_15435 [Acidobacteriia bacterium]|nr:hypothetical protein [Terriglobia bacterium]